MDSIVRNVILVWVCLNIVLTPVAAFVDIHVERFDAVYDDSVDLGQFGKVSAGGRDAQVLHFEDSWVFYLIALLVPGCMVFARMKKAQMEIMGLALVVILMSLGILFVIRFVALKPKSEIRESYTQTQTAQNILTSLLKTTTQCRANIPYTISDLLKSCARGQSLTCDDGNDSCSYVNNTIKYILNRTLEEWSRKYALNISSASRNVTYIKHGNASSPDKQVKIVPLPLYPQPGSLLIRLELFR